MSTELNQSKNKNYIQKIQSEIDSLEKQLFSQKNPSKANNLKKNNGLKINKDLSVPIETTISNVNDDSVMTQNTIINNNMTSTEKAELYKIIMRERNENAELERLRLEQNEKYKLLKNKYKILEKNNLKMKKEVESLRKDKEIQQIRILELEKELKTLKGEN